MNSKHSVDEELEIPPYVSPKSTYGGHLESFTKSFRTMTKYITGYVYFLVVLSYISPLTAAALAECPADLKCSSLRRAGCDWRTDGACGSCLYPYIDVAGTCITEEAADKAIKTLEELLAAKLADSSGSESKPVGSAAKKSDELAEPITSSPAEPGSPTTTALTNEQDGAASPEKRVSADAMSGPSIENLSGTGSDKSTVGFSRLAFFCIIAGAALICIVSIVIAGVCWYRLQKVKKSMQPAEYMGYGGGDGPPKDPMVRSDSSGDRKLAHSAQMYHYQHHKQQMMALESALSDRLDESDAEEAEENEDGNYTVYECPGLAPAGEMEVSNPLFQAASKTSPSTSPTASPSSLPSPPQSSMSTSQEGDDSAYP